MTNWAPIGSPALISVRRPAGNRSGVGGLPQAAGQAVEHRNSTSTARGSAISLSNSSARGAGVGQRGLDMAAALLKKKWAPNAARTDRKSTRLNSSHLGISYAV